MWDQVQGEFFNVSLSAAAIVESLPFTKPALFVNLQFVSLLQFNLPYFTEESRISELRELNKLEIAEDIS
jgi:hypothetical protein